MLTDELFGSVSEETVVECSVIDGEFKVKLSDSSSNFFCRDKAFVSDSLDGVFEYINLLRLFAAFERCEAASISLKLLNLKFDSFKSSHNNSNELFVAIMLY